MSILLGEDLRDRGRLGAGPERERPGYAAPSGGRPRFPVTWPLVALFVAFPAWWLLGVSAFIWPIIAVPMVLALIRRRQSRAPVVFFFWLAFISWVLLSGLQLQSSTKIITFSYRLTLYAAAGVLFLYVYNLPRASRLDTRVLRILTIFWMVVVAGGYAGILLGSHTFVPPFMHILPHGLRSQPFVQELVQPVFANVEGFLGYPVPRPSAPFTYTNNWGGNIAVLTPVALAAAGAAGPGRRRKLIIAVLVASLVPMVFSLNRGMFLSLGAGLVYVTIRLAMRGRFGALASLLALTALMAAILVVTPLGHLLLSGISGTHGHSNATRTSLSQQALAGANQSPWFGHGEPQPVSGAVLAGTPAIGTQGQLWMLLYSNGYPATVFFLGFFIAVFWQTRRARGMGGLWLHSVVVIALAQIAVYGYLPEELQVMMVVAALAYRRCLRPAATSSTGSAQAGPAPVRGRFDAGITPRASARRVVMQPGQGAPTAVSTEAAVVARGSLVNLGAMVTGAGLAFGLTVLVSRWLQPSGAGAFFELIALFTILSNTFELGADTGLTRWISRARAIGGLEDVRRVVAIALLPVLMIGIGAAAALWVAAPELARIFLHGLAPGAGASDIRIVAPLVPLGALSACIVDGARGFGRMWPYLVIEGLGKPAARVALVIAVLAVGWGLHGAVLAWGLPIAVGLAVGWLIFARIIRAEVPVRPWTRATTVATQPDPSAEEIPGPDLARSAGEVQVPEPKRPARAEFPVTPEAAETLELPAILEVPVPAQVPASDDLRHDRARHRAASGPPRGRLAAEFWRFTAPRAFQGTFQVVILWLDILLVGAMVSRYAAGVYGAVSKLALVGTFALEGNRLAIGPQLSALLARREYGRAADLYQSATRWLMLASWPLYLVFAVFPTVVLGIFGPRYTAGAAALAVLSLAMLVNLGTGNITVVLLMGGKSSWSAINAAAALIVNIGLNLVLLPRIGILGAAIAWGASIVVDNVAAMIEVRWVLGLAPFGSGYGAVAAVTVGCFGITGVAARALLGETLPGLAVTLAVGLAVFAAALYLARAPLQLTGIAGALRPRAVPAPTSEAGQQAA